MSKCLFKLLGPSVALILLLVSAPLAVASPANRLEAPPGTPPMTSKAVSARAGDYTPPVTTATGWDDLWHNRDVDIHLSATDEGGSGVKSIWAAFDDGAWASQPGDRAVATVFAYPNHSNDGVRTVRYYAMDNKDLKEETKSLKVRIDTRGPTCAARNVKVRRGRKCQLLFAVRDSLSPQATCVLRIKTARGATKKTFKWGYDDVRPAGKWWYVNYRCTLKKGTYRIFVTGKDLAGNNQSKVGKAKLVVR